jgi:hypothetical protein
MKKIKFVSLAALVLVSGGLLAACSPDEPKTEASTASTEATTETSAAEDVVSTASISDKQDVITKALSAEGNWIVAVTNDMTFDSDVTIAGEFHDKGDAANDIYRKFALYNQDENHNVTANYTITVPKLIVESENLNIVNGTVKGDVEVKANGFVLNGSKIEGNLTFDKKEYQDSAVLDQEGSSVTGEVTVAE